ncbi:MAG: hypothetical protein V1874_10695 [Spirochaetota bacterium]
MKSICVVHLVREKNGIDTFKKFLESYLHYDSGIEHDLLIIFKGFSNKKIVSDYKKLLLGISYKEMYVKDFGFDIRPYFKAAKTFNYRFFCFLNSFSRILDNKWLFKMYNHIIKHEIGLVGTSGSYESYYTNLVNWHNLKWYYKLFINHYFQLIRLKFFYNPFPNYHIRTNGFLISREILNKIHCGLILTKKNAYKFESGKDCLTKQVMKMGYEVVVVGKNGKGYKKEEWFLSETFRQASLNNLLIADNQTDLFLNADKNFALKLARYAWGNNYNIYF